jgi:hypothetical protein
MKKLLVFLFVAVFSLTAFSQEDGGDEFSFDISDKMKKSDRLCVDLYYQLWQDLPDSMALYGFSRGININMMIDMPISSSRFSFAYGFGFGIYNVYSDAQPYREKDSLGEPTGEIGFDKIKKTVPEALTYKTNKLTTAYIDLPIEFRYRHVNGMKFSVFGKFGYLISSHTKYKGDDPNLGADYELTQKIKNIPAILKYRASVGAKLGWKNYAFFGSYSLTSLFDDYGPQMYPINLGVSLSF